MANLHEVTEPELEPVPCGCVWACEICDREFKVGDIAVALTVSGEHGPDPYELDPMTPDDPYISNYIESDWVCAFCFIEGRRPEES